MMEAKLNDVDLLNNKELIIMQESIKYCEENNTEKIRYSTLKRLCDDKLSVLSNGQIPEFGGQFENLVKRMHSTEDFHQRFLTRKKVSTKKTFIYPDVIKMKSHLIQKSSKLGTSISWKWRNIDQEDLVKAYKKIAIKNSSKKFLCLSKKANHYKKTEHEFMKQRALESAGFLSTHFFDISYAHSHHKDFKFDDEILIDIIKLDYK